MARSKEEGHQGPGGSRGTASLERGQLEQTGGWQPSLGPEQLVRESGGCAVGELGEGGEGELGGR